LSPENQKPVANAYMLFTWCRAGNSGSKATLISMGVDGRAVATG
jgi:hypothetical protein